MPLGFVEGILFVGFLPTHQVIPTILAAHLPATRIATEERDVAALRDVSLEVVAHRRRPVLVMADTEHELVVLEHLGVELEVAVDRVVEAVAVAFCPLDERELPIAIDPSERSLEADPTTEFIPGLVHLVPVSRPPVCVEAEPAPAVVSVVGVGCELQENLGIPARARRPHDKEHPVALCLTRARQRLVATAGPRFRNLDGGGNRPIASVRAGVLGNWVFCGPNPVPVPDHLALRPDPCDLKIDLRQVGGEMEGKFLTRDVTPLPRIAVDERLGSRDERRH